MKSIEVMAHFFKKKMQIFTIAYEGEVYRVSHRKELSADKFSNKKLRYYRIGSDKNIFILSFDSKTLNFELLSVKLESKKKK